MKGAALLLAAAVAALLFLSVPETEALKIGETCAADGDCDAGLQCQSCAAEGETRRRCTRLTPFDPQSKGKALPFNKYSWLTTHNSFALSGSTSATGAAIIAPTNQEDTVTAQLKNGVRGLMLDMYNFENDIWLCHSFGGNCYNFTAFQPAINVLKEIQAFLEQNPTAIITIFIEDYVKSPQSLRKLFDAAGLRKYWFPVTNMPKDGGDWPLISDMISQNQRLVVFTSKSAKEASEAIAYEWNYVIENQYGDGGMKAGSCPNRAESNPMNNKTKSLVLMNYFPDNPDSVYACMNNSAPLIDMLNTCHKLSSNRWANFVAVDFYKRNDGGGAQLAVDTVNGHLVCGCDSIAYCKANAPFGTCDAPPAVPATHSGNTPAGVKQNTDGTSTNAGTRLSWWWLLQNVPVVMAMLLA